MHAVTIMDLFKLVRIARGIDQAVTITNKYPKMECDLGFTPVVTLDRINDHLFCRSLGKTV
jgi:hypothetical protein